MIPQKKPKFTVETPCTDLQKLAQKENFAIFTLRGMQGQLIALRNCETIPKDNINYLRGYLEGLEIIIKDTQKLRKEKKKAKENK